jgi:glycosyltransferase involved in cell wall biosynthesis
LVVAGEKPTTVERNAINALGLSARVHFCSPNDRQLAYIYSRAACFVFPSLAEGFGITTLEAMSVGCPVALSRTPIFQEVGSDAALYFDPHSPNELAERVLEAGRPADRGIHSAKSLARVREFTPTRTLPLLVAAWRSLLS